MSRASSRHEFHQLDSSDTSVRSRQSCYPPSENTSIDQDVSLWQIGYLSSARIITYVLAFFALLFSIAAVVVFTLTRKNAQGSAVLNVESIPLTTGSCDSNLHTYNLIAHLFINLLGTIVLGSSNYLQQICTSTSVTEVAKQLKRHGDVKFGANSPSAVFRQRSTLTLLWLSLVITSLPIHIMLNGIMGYAVFPIDAGGQAIESGASIDAYITANTTWTEISSSQCVTYLLNAVAYVTDFDNITIVVNPSADFGYYDSYMQSTSSDTLLGTLPRAADIANCYVQFVDSQCELTVRWFPLFCTATALLIKTLIVFIAIRRHAHFRKRVFNSLGDMIALGTRHPLLRQYCHGKTPGMFSGPYSQQRTRWVRALGGWDVVVAIFWWVSALGVMIYGIVSWVEVGSDLDISSRMKVFGLGTINPSTSFVPGGTANAIDGTQNTFPIQVIIANSPQLWLSFGYLLWNNQITRIWMEREWRSYYRNTHVPRVSYKTDETGVRATRWLQLPYWLTAILMTLSTVMHWLVSQTMFVVQILGSPGYFYMNYSPLAIICIGIVAAVLVLAITIYYFIPVRTWMPLMAGSARVVFESCVRLDSASLPVGGVAWGDISTTTERLAGFGEIVGPLVKGVMYPGLIVEEHRDNSEYMFRVESDTEPLFRRY
jgi:hypothetical protein